MGPLCDIMNKYGSDKGSGHHNYTESVYYDLFKNIKDEPLFIFELGLGTNNTSVPSNMGQNGKPGASLHGWSEFFPNAKIFGADIDKDILFQTDKIKTFYCDQTNPQVIKDMWSSLPQFDIIIEDGLHTYDANVCFFENSIHKLKPGGIYFIEDISINDITKFQNKIKNEWSNILGLSFDLKIIPSKLNTHDNNMLIVKKSA